jgi:hypothetical protein
MGFVHLACVGQTHNFYQMALFYVIVSDVAAQSGCLPALSL